MAKAIGSDELKTALEKISSVDVKRAAAGIGIAAEIESESIAFYSMMAKKFKGSEEENFFSFLASQEEGHLAAIRELKHGLESKGKWPEPKALEWKRPEIFPKKDWDKGKKEGLTGVLFALWKEKQAQEFYEDMAERAGSASVKKFFLALAKFEKGHAEMLSEYAEESYYSRELIMG